MGIGIFVDKAYRPSDEEICATIGLRSPLWNEMLAYIKASYPVEQDLKYLYGRNYGWAMRFRIGKQVLTSLYPTQGGFTVQVNLSPDAVEAADGYGLHRNAEAAIKRAYPYPEGRWVFIPVESAQDSQDIQHLLALRTQSKRLVKSGKPDKQNEGCNQPHT